MAQFPIVDPDDAVLRTALRGATAYGLSWSDAHLWAHVEVPWNIRSCLPRTSSTAAFTAQ